MITPTSPVETLYDPKQFGCGFLGLGRVTMCGASKTAFTRLAVEPKAGDSTLALATAVTGWRAGDKVHLPGSAQWAIESTAMPKEWEDATIASVAADGSSCVLTAPLKYAHPGARDGDDQLTFLPHVANLTRNVTVRSAASAAVRGHCLFTTRADVDLRYVNFHSLGRTTLGPTDSATFAANGATTKLPTNQIGRYPVHFHHCFGPKVTPANGNQFTVFGNSITCLNPTHRFRWPITIHGSHYGLVGDNVVVNWAGSGITTEDGDESFNVFQRNLVSVGRGEGDRAGSGMPGNEGSAFWFRGPNNIVRDNVAANWSGTGVEAAYGYKYYMVYLGDIKVPNFKGADTMTSGQYTTKPGNAMPLLEFARNEVYGIENGLTAWWLNSWDVTAQAGPTSTVKDHKSWHIARYHFYGYPMCNVVFDGYVVRGNRHVLGNQHESVMGWWCGDYPAKQITIRNADIQGCRTGIHDPYFAGSATVVENSRLRNNTDIRIRTPGASGSDPDGRHRQPKSMTLRNVLHGSTVGWNLGGLPRLHVRMEYHLNNGSSNLIVLDTVHVQSYNGQAGTNFQVFYREQVGSFVVPKSSGNLVGSPVAGKTNAQNWTDHQVAIAGAVASGTTTRPEIDGLVK